MVHIELASRWESDSKILARWAYNVVLDPISESRYNFMISILSTEAERAKIQKLRFLKDRQLSLISKLMLYYAISQIVVKVSKDQFKDNSCRKVFEKISFTYNNQGKPFLHKDFISLYPFMSLISFNISHHGDLAVLVVGTNCNLGVDVMKIELPPSDSSPEIFMSWYKDELTEIEWKQINCTSSNVANDMPEASNSLNRFFEFWCLKESLIKALGIGLQLPLSSISFFLNMKPSTCITSWTATSFTLNDKVLTSEKLRELDLTYEDFTGWSFEESYLDHDHCCALAIKPNLKESTAPFISDQFFIWSSKQLIAKISDAL